MFDHLVQWLSKFIPEVPEEIAVCEFDCRKTDCLMGHWATCSRRLESMPREEDGKEKREH